MKGGKNEIYSKDSNQDVSTCIAHTRTEYAFTCRYYYLRVCKLKSSDGEHNLSCCDEHVHWHLQEYGDTVWRIYLNNSQAVALKEPKKSHNFMYCMCQTIYTCNNYVNQVKIVQSVKKACLCNYNCIINLQNLISHNVILYIRICAEIQVYTCACISESVNNHILC